MTPQTANPAATTKSPMTTESLPPNDILDSYVLEGLVEFEYSPVPTAARSRRWRTLPSASPELHL